MRSHRPSTLRIAPSLPIYTFVNQPLVRFVSIRRARPCSIGWSSARPGSAGRASGLWWLMMIWANREPPARTDGVSNAWYPPVKRAPPGSAVARRATDPARDGRDADTLAMQFKDHDDLPKSDQRPIPRSGQRDIIAQQRRPLARVLRLSPSDQLGNFQPAQVGIIRPALTRGASQPRALPEPDVNLSIHPAPIIRPLVPGSSGRTWWGCAA